MPKTKKPEKKKSPASSSTKKPNLKKAKECTAYLIDLHKLQRALLADLKKSLPDSPEENF